MTNKQLLGNSGIVFLQVLSINHININLMLGIQTYVVPVPSALETPKSSCPEDSSDCRDSSLENPRTWRTRPARTAHCPNKCSARWRERQSVWRWLPGIPPECREARRRFLEAEKWVWRRCPQLSCWGSCGQIQRNPQRSTSSQDCTREDLAGVLLRRSEVLCKKIILVDFMVKK